MKLKNAMLVYNPGTDQVKVVEWPDTQNLSEGYSFSVLRCFSYFPKTRRLQERMLFIEAYQAIVRDNVDPKAMHKALLVIDEYGESVAEDMQWPLL